MVCKRFRTHARTYIFDLPEHIDCMQSFWWSKNAGWKLCGLQIHLKIHFHKNDYLVSCLYHLLLLRLLLLCVSCNCQFVIPLFFQNKLNWCGTYEVLHEITFKSTIAIRKSHQWYDSFGTYLLGSLTIQSSTVKKQGVCLCVYVCVPWMINLSFLFGFVIKLKNQKLCNRRRQAF